MRYVVCLAIALMVTAGASPRPDGQGSSAQSTDSQAREHYNFGVAKMQKGEYSDGLQELTSVVSTYQNSVWAAQAVARMVEYSLDVTRDYPEARKASSNLQQYQNRFPAVSALASLYDGRITLATGRSAKDIKDAINYFEKFETFGRGNDRIPEARYYAAEAARLGGMTDDAIERYRALADAYPVSPWTAKALLRYARCLVEKQKVLDALSTLQRVRATFDKNPEAAADVAAAIDLSTIIYRLHIRAAQKQPLYVYRGRTIAPPPGKFEGDVLGVSIAPTGQLLVATRDGVSLVDSAGKFQPSIRASEVSLAFFRDQRVGYVTKSVLHTEGERDVSLTQPPQPDGKVRMIEEPSAMAMTWRRYWLVTDPKEKTIWSFSALGEAPKPFVAPGTSITPDRLVINDLDQILVLDRDKKTVTVFGRDGAQLGQIPQKGDGYQFDNPVDLAVDTLGYIYVLDRGRANVVVFLPQRMPFLTFTLPEKDPGAFRKATAFALDSAGRMFIFDEGAHRLQVYQ